RRRPGGGVAHAVPGVGWAKARSTTKVSPRAQCSAVPTRQNPPRATTSDAWARHAFEMWHPLRFGARAFAHPTDARLLDFEVELAHQRAPLGLLAVDVAGVFLRRRGQGIAALGVDALLDLVRLDQRAQRRVELVDDRPRRAGGRKEPVVQHR